MRGRRGTVIVACTLLRAHLGRIWGATSGRRTAVRVG